MMREDLEEALGFKYASEDKPLLKFTPIRKVLETFIQLLLLMPEDEVSRFVTEQMEHRKRNLEIANIAGFFTRDLKSNEPLEQATRLQRLFEVLMLALDLSVPSADYDEILRVMQPLDLLALAGLKLLLQGKLTEEASYGLVLKVVEVPPERIFWIQGAIDRSIH